MSSYQPVWQERYQIHSYEVDVTGQAMMPFLCRFMQESAWHHAEHLGVGFDHLAAQNRAWVLARQRVVVETYPRWGDTITVLTWPTGKGRLFWQRDFIITNEGNEKLAQATTSWFIIDLTARKPQRADSIELERPAHTERVFATEPGKIEPLSNGIPHHSLKVGYSDVDVNQHVNNVKYIEWFLDAFDLEFHVTHHLCELDINYLAEATYNDKLVVIQQTGHPLTFWHSLTRPADQAELCRAKTMWQPLKQT